MSKKSIFSYDKIPQCRYCAHNLGEGETVECAFGACESACEHFRYDVFKRIPRRAPELPSFEEDDFSL